MDKEVHVGFDDPVNVNGFPILRKNEHDIVGVAWIPATGPYSKLDAKKLGD